MTCNECYAVVTNVYDVNVMYIIIDYCRSNCLSMSYEVQQQPGHPIYYDNQFTVFQ